MEQIREFLGQMKIYLRFDMAVSDKLEEHDDRIKHLEEENKRNVAALRSLEKKYGELLFAISSWKKDGLK